MRVCTYGCVCVCVRLRKELEGAYVQLDFLGWGVIDVRGRFQGACGGGCGGLLLARVRCFKELGFGWGKGFRLERGGKGVGERGWRNGIEWESWSGGCYYLGLITG